MSKTIAAWLVAAVFAVAFAGTASAGNSTLTLNPQLAASALQMGSQVTFSVATNRTDRPWVSVACYQSGALVYKQYNGMFASYSGTQVFTLGPTTKWTSGGANCTGSLLYFDSSGREHSLTTTSFVVQ